MKANYDWQVGETIYYFYEDEPKTYYRGKVMKRDLVDMYNKMTYCINTDSGTIAFIPYEHVCDEDTCQYINDVARGLIMDSTITVKFTPDSDSYNSMDKQGKIDEDKLMLENKNKYEDKYKYHVTLSMSYLSSLFGVSFVWKQMGHELIGCSSLLNQIIVIDDGACSNDYDTNTGWHTLMYSFNDSSYTAQEWFDNNYKYCNLDDVHANEFTINGID